jgi:hypothetical protein
VIWTYLDRCNCTDLFNPRRDEFGETIAPDVLVDCDGHKQWSSDRLVRVHGVGAHDGRDGSHLHTGSAESNHYDDFPWPLSFHTDSSDNVANVHDDNVGDHC